MFKKLEHIGIAVNDLESGEKLFKRLFNVNPYKREVVESENVVTSFFKIGETKIELLAPLNEDSVIAKFLAKKGEGFHHLAYEVENISEELERLQNQGFELIHKQPKKGADNKMIAFLHPKSTGGILTELCQEIKKD